MSVTAEHLVTSGLTAPPELEAPRARNVVLCERCDAAYERVALARGEVAHCVRCGAALAIASAPDTDRLLALATTAALFFAISAANPILSIEFGGLHTSASLWAAASSLGHGWISGAAIVLGLTMCGIPLLQIGLALWVLVFARLARRAPGCRRVLILLHALRPWSMTEVFVLGVLVAAVKLSSWVHVNTDLGAWTLAGLAATIAILNLEPAAAWWQLLEEPPR